MGTNSKALRPPRGRLSPWIEALIQSHGVQREEGGWRCLKAQVIGVGQMSASQAADSDGSIGLLFLSDGAVQIPAVLTAAAWEHLQDNEDRETLSSLLNTTVCILDARLLFHMAPEQTRCKFFLSVEELTTAAAGPVKEKTPCCTTLPTVRAAICCAWRAGLSQDQTLWSHSGLELSELLGEWRHDCLQEVMDDVSRRLAASRRPLSPQPSTSTSGAAPRTRHGTGWDLDRVRYKGEERFSVPMRYLLIPERLDELSGSKVTEPQDSRSVEDPDWRVSEPPAAGRPGESPDSPVEVQITDLMDEVPPFNPWDDFPPPSASNSLSDPSTPMDTVPPATIKSNSDLRATMQTAAQPSIQAADQPAMQTVTQPTMQTTTQPAMQTTTDLAIQITTQPAMQTTTQPAMQTTTQSAIQTTTQSVLQTTTQSVLQTTTQSVMQTTTQPAMQTSSQSVMQTTTQPAMPTTTQPAMPTTTQPAMQTSTQSVMQITTQPVMQTADQLAMQTTTQLAMQTTSSKGSGCLPPYQQQTPSSSFSRKRRHSEDSPETLTTLQEEEEEDEVPRSPPSWLFPSQAVDSDLESNSIPTQTTSRRTPSMHSDGSPFSYSYRSTGRNLQDFSRFSVSGSMLQWAVKYLITPKQTAAPSGGLRLTGGSQGLRLTYHSSSLSSGMLFSSSNVQ